MPTIKLLLENSTRNVKNTDNMDRQYFIEPSKITEIAQIGFIL